jgi:hypothetical protein
MRIDSSGNVGIGTSSPGYKLDVAGGLLRSINSYSAAYNSLILQNTASDGYAQTLYFVGSDGANGAASVSYAPGIFFTIGPTANDTTTPIVFRNNNATERMRIDSSGRVLIGTTTFGGGLTLAKSDATFRSGSNAYPFPSGYSYLMVDASSTNSQNNWIGITGEYGVSTGSANLLLQANFNNTSQQAGNYIGSEATTATSAVLTFGRMIGGASTGTAAAKSEAMRLDSSGNLLVGTTSRNSVEKFRVGSSDSGGQRQVCDFFNTVATSTTKIANRLIRVSANANGADNCIEFTDNVANNYYFGGNNGGAYVMANSNGVRLSNGGTSWASDSDERVKDIIEPITDAANKVLTLRAVIGKYKTDEEGTRRSFLIAQDVQAVLPEAVVAQQDEIGTLSLAYTDVIPLLVAAIQELNAKVTALEAQLENK